MLEIINYSEKSIAVTGDTKRFKDILKIAGGRFNPRLKSPKNPEERFAGWIFSKVREQQLLDLLSGNGVKCELPTV